MIFPPDSKNATTVSGSDLATSEYDHSESSAVPEKGQGPPSYNDATGSANDAFVTGPRVNYIYVHERDGHIKGEWTIDPTVTVPPSLLAELKEGEERANLRLHSQDGHVAGRVRLVSDKPTKSFLFASSKDGHVKMSILSRQNQRFKLKMHAQDGSVTAQIPSDFEGPISFMLKDGSLKLSAGVERRLAHFSRSGKNGKGFIGSLETSGYADIGDNTEAWAGDELILSSRDGNIRIEYIDEVPETVEGGSSKGGFKGFVRKVVEIPALGSLKGWVDHVM
ncbi:hypothetical protein FRB94_007703 [Tulasnella sp. JGI-2019a]|nr:hypothetical protein FRB93_007732 [Tulasnella sp. JGI-2019a]KAG8997348.1 hypothetical protein FRB94_007703 [Tulasnella sp. JGI-2019a]KAG9027496.1 hypothetical protein FRB95_007676 [Tulasnella sp. JGI-2019a]